MSRYKQYLDKIGVISEEKFNQVSDMFPDVDISLLDIYDHSCTQSEVAKAFIDVILEDFNYVYSEDIDVETKTIDLWDVQSMEELKEIEKKLSGWTIANYDELVEEIQKSEKEYQADAEHHKKVSMLMKIADNISVDEIKEIADKYANKNESPQSCS
jgi:hypothetical protein